MSNSSDQVRNSFSKSSGYQLFAFKNVKERHNNNASKYVIRNNYDERSLCDFWHKTWMEFKEPGHSALGKLLHFYLPCM